RAEEREQRDAEQGDRQCRRGDDRDEDVPAELCAEDAAGKKRPNRQDEHGGKLPPEECTAKKHCPIVPVNPLHKPENRGILDRSIGEEPSVRGHPTGAGPLTRTEMTTCRSTET